MEEEEKKCPANSEAPAEETMRLNKFLAHAGICARRKADEYISKGWVTVNDEIVHEMGFRVKLSDVVKYKGNVIEAQKKVYVLLNKPKDILSTVTDDRGRQTVIDVVAKATKERIYPVGRLDYQTTGLLLLTNDGALAQKLSHPSFENEKVYVAELDKKLSKKDFDQIAEGIELEDGPIKVDEIAWPEPGRKNRVGLSLHSGRNRIVRRIFEHLNYRVRKLDRVMYAGLTKKDLPRGKWRYLSEKELIRLKYFL